MSFHPEYSSRQVANEGGLAAGIIILRHLVRDETGQDLIEYALLGALIAMGAILGIRRVSNSIVTSLNSVGTGLTNAT